MRGRRVREIALVCSQPRRPKDPKVPLGHAAVAAAIRFRCRIPVADLVYDCNDCSPEALAARILADILGRYTGDGRSVLVAFGAYLWNERIVQLVIRELREAGFRGWIIVGGPSVSFRRPGVWEDYAGADLIVQGQAEDAFVALCKGDDPSTVPGVLTPGTIVPAHRPQICVGELPSPFLRDPDALIGNTGEVRWETKRGCKSHCAFCQHHEGSTLLLGREFSLRRLLAEMDLLVRRRVTRVSVIDPTFNLPGTRYLAILDELRRRGLSAQLSLQCRFEGLDQAFVHACRGLNVFPEFGLQSTEDAVLRNINRNNHMPSVERAVEALHAAHIEFMVSLIYGLPGQSLQSFMNDVNYCLGLRIPVIRAFPLQLYPGTKLSAEAQHWGIVCGDDTFSTVRSTAAMTACYMTRAAEVATVLRSTEHRHPASIS